MKVPDNYRLSPNFTLEELTRSHTAEEAGIGNVPSDPLVIGNLHALAYWVLEPIRAALGNAPVTVTSGYRCPKLNEHPAIKGAAKSAHLYGRAADIVAKGKTTRQIMHAIRGLTLHPGVRIVAFEYAKRRFVHVQFWYDPGGTSDIQAFNDDPGNDRGGDA